MESTPAGFTWYLGPFGGLKAILLLLWYAEERGGGQDGDEGIEDAESGGDVPLNCVLRVVTEYVNLSMRIHLEIRSGRSAQHLQLIQHLKPGLPDQEQIFKCFCC